MSAVYSAEALADLDDIESDLSRAGAHVARLFQTRLAQALEFRERFPLSAAEYEPPDPRFPGLRVFAIHKFKSHAVYYQPTADGIRVVRILHTSRDAATVFSTDPDPPTPPGS